MRTSFLGILCGLGLLALPLRGDVDKPSPDEAAPERGEPGRERKASARDEHEAIHRKLEDEGEENLKEIARLMEKIRDGLRRKKTGDPTQSDQREVVKKIEDLIDKIGKG